MPLEHFDLSLECRVEIQEVEGLEATPDSALALSHFAESE